MSLGPLATYNTAAGASNTSPTEATVDAIENTFFKARVPAGEPRICACSADFYAAIPQIERFTEERMIGSGGLTTTPDAVLFSLVSSGLLFSER